MKPKLKEVKAKSILVRSKLPETDYVINPYTGCVHGCVYCYAKFMSRITGHNEGWGDYCDVKINLPEVLSGELKRAKKGKVLLSSVTDPYNPLEKKYQLTRKALRLLIEKQFPVSILTKSSLVLRDIDLLKRLKNVEVGITITSLDDEVRRKFEPFSSSVEERIKALELLHKEKIRTYTFIGPILPYLTDVVALINRLKGIVDFFMFEDLNVLPSNKDKILGIIKENWPELEEKYKEILKGKAEFWKVIREKIQEIAREKSLDFRIYFKHN